MKTIYSLRRKTFFRLRISKRKIANQFLVGMLFFSFLTLTSQLQAQATYCTPTYSQYISSAHSITSVTINSTFQHNPSATTHDYTSQVVSVDAGNPLHFVLASNGYCGVGIAVDWNNDGDFDDANEVMAVPLYIATSPANYDTTVAIPTGITSGSYRLRLWNIGANSGGGTPAGSACGAYNYGSWADYTLTILPPCSGTPTAGTIPATMAVCPNVDFTLTAAGATAASGMTNHWQSHGESSSTWTDISGAINPSYTVSGGVTDTVYYRYISSCDASAMADTTNEMEVTINPVTQCYCTPGNSSSYHITAFNTTNAPNNIQQTGISSSPNGYNDFTSVDTAAQQQTFDFDFSYQATGSTFGSKIWIDWNDDGQFDNSEIVYQTNSYGTTFSGTITVPLTATIGLTRMRIGISYTPSSGPATACEVGSSYYYQDYMFNVLPAPSCIAPSDLTATNLTESSADLGWTENSGASEWQVEYDTTGFSQGTGTMESTIGSNPYTLSGLTPNTEYDYYVRAVCGSGDSSFWTGPYTFHTPCSAYSANGFWENFEDTSSTLNCWTILDANNDGDKWEFYQSTYTNYANSGSWSVRIHTDYNNGANDDYLISPAITLTGAESMKFSYLMQSSSEPNDFEVLLSTTGTDPADFTDTLMHDASYNNANYKDSVVDLTSYTGNVYIAFHVPNGGLDGYYLYLDDVRFGECIPTPGTDGSVNACQTGGNVMLPSVIQTNNQNGVWDFSANPSVLQNGNELNVSTLAAGAYDVEYIVQGLCDGEADTTIATVNVYPPSSAGIDGTMIVCKNEPVNLFDGLHGNADLGGTWYDPTQQPITGSFPNAGTIPGSFNYSYIVNNGVCGNDTSTVAVVVDGTCDWLGIQNEAFNKLSVFPNPTSNMINIVNPSNESNLKIVVLDMNGRVVLRDNTSLANNEKATLSLGRLDKGIYTLKVSNTKGQKVFKIVKQ